MKKIIAVIVVVCAVLGAANAQTDPLLNHYMFNRTFINPASTGNTNDINFFFALREQWVGFEDAPSTQVFAVNGYIDPIRSGLGLAVINDHEGAVGEHRLNAKVNYAYHLFLSRKAYLSFGLSAGLLYCKTNFDNARTANPETANNLKSQSAYNPDFDFGLEFNMEKFTLGASCTHLIKSNDDVNSVETPRHFYAYGKYTFDINDKFAVVPQVTFMNNEANVENNQLEMNVTGFYMKKYWAGLGYRLNESANVIVGLAIADYLRLGYSYDFTVGDIRKEAEAGGSHELMLLCRIGKTGSKTRGNGNPRFFE